MTSICYSPRGYLKPQRSLSKICVNNQCHAFSDSGFCLKFASCKMYIRQGWGGGYKLEEFLLFVFSTQLFFEKSFRNKNLWREKLVSLP